MSKSTLPLLLQSETLAAQLDNPQLLLLDLSRAQTYARCHIAGAIAVAPRSLQCGIPPAVGKLPSVEQLSTLFSQVGLTPDRHVVVYDDEGGGWAGRLIWTLDAIGHTRYSYLNGGIHAWLAQGHSVVTEQPSVDPSHYQVTIEPKVIADSAEVLAHLGDPTVVLWDARSKEEYEGSRLLAQRGGHIPGAIHIDWLDLIDRNNYMCLVDINDLQARLDRCGLTKNKTIITYCQTHHRSALAYLALKILGYTRIKGYDGAWAEWGNNVDLPVETGCTYGG